jgi:hypothetical protein
MDWKGVAESVHKFEIWILLGVTICGIMVLYGPEIPNLNIKAAREWPWTGPITLLFGILTITKAISNSGSAVMRSLRSRFTKTAVIIVDERPNMTWWSSSRSDSGIFNVQMNINVKIHNLSDEYLEFAKVELLSPCPRNRSDVNHIVFLIKNPITREFSQNEFVHPKDTIEGAIQCVVSNLNRKSGRDMKAKFKVTDHNGKTYKVSSNLFCTN